MRLSGASIQDIHKLVAIPLPNSYSKLSSIKMPSSKHNSNHKYNTQLYSSAELPIAVASALTSSVVFDSLKKVKKPLSSSSSVRREAKFFDKSQQNKSSKKTVIDEQRFLKSFDEFVAEHSFPISGSQLVE